MTYLEGARPGEDRLLYGNLTPAVWELGWGGWGTGLGPLSAFLGWSLRICNKTLNEKHLGSAP